MDGDAAIGAVGRVTRGVSLPWPVVGLAHSPDCGFHAILGGLAGGVGGCALGAQLGESLDRHALA
ncbi:hypothetical protein [Stutzerimonas stutzeri]|uniref:hypothetical protein n=1 Tax=Stutzerimonas stutzeri TaxID=316 RepID=UPI003AF35A8E